MGILRRGGDELADGSRYRMREKLLSIIPVYLAHRLTREEEGLPGGRGAATVEAEAAGTI